MQSEPNLSRANSAGEEPVLITADVLASPARADGRADFEKGISYAPRLTIVLIVINTLVFAWELAMGALKSEQSIIRAGALHRASVLQGQIWRLFSAVFLHGSTEHLIGNCIVLYILGMACEHGMGIVQTGLMYLFSGLCGSLCSVTISSGPSVGASGAIFGMMGCLIVFLYRFQERFYVRDKRIGAVLLAWAAWQVVTGFLSPGIDNFAHIGGFVGGAAVGTLMKPRRGVVRQLQQGMSCTSVL